MDFPFFLVGSVFWHGRIIRDGGWCRGLESFAVAVAMLVECEEDRQT